MIGYLPHLNAALNTIACLLLIRGIWLIRQGREQSHKRTMIAAFAVSTLFLISYLIYHQSTGHRPLPESVQGPLRIGYLTMLASHIILAATIPFLALTVIYLGLKDRRHAHRKWARITFPLWLYVSVTGVLIYIALYWCFTA